MNEFKLLISSHKKFIFSVIAAILLLLFLGGITSSTFNTARTGSSLAPASLGGFEYGADAPGMGARDAVFQEQVAKTQGSNLTAAREIIKTASLALVVENTETAAETLKTMAGGYGGFVDHAQVYETAENKKIGTVTLRVPAARFEEAIEDIKALAIKVTNETVNAQDVTEQLVDIDARLRNLRAEETQYLEIMKRAVRVEDALSVSQRLYDVRGRIEQLEAQRKYLSEQVAMTTISVSLVSEADVKVLGIVWSPLVVIKRELHNALNGLVEYVNAMIVFLLKLPIFILWIGTLALILYMLWKIGMRIKRNIDKSQKIP